MRVFISGTSDTLRVFYSYLTPTERSYCIFYFSDDQHNHLSDELLEYIYQRMSTAANIFCLFEDGYFDKQYTLYELDLIAEFFLTKSSGAALADWNENEFNILQVKDIPVTGGSSVGAGGT